VSSGQLFRAFRAFRQFVNGGVHKKQGWLFFSHFLFVTIILQPLFGKQSHPNGGIPMKLVRVVFVALAVLLPTSWTVAKAADPAPAAGEPAKKDTKSKKEEGDKKADKK